MSFTAWLKVNRLYKGYLKVRIPFVIFNNKNNKVKNYK